MKKFIFSAVLMVAFVGSSRASNEIKVPEIKSLETMEKDCTAYALANALAESEASPTQLTLPQLLAAIATYYSFCEDSEGIILDSVQIKKAK